MTKENWLKKMVPTLTTLFLILPFVACSSELSTKNSESIVYSSLTPYMHHSPGIKVDTLTKFIQSKSNSGFASIIAENITNVASCLSMDSIYLSAFVANFSGFNPGNLGNLSRGQLVFLREYRPKAEVSSALARCGKHYLSGNPEELFWNNFGDMKANIFYTALYIRTRVASHHSNPNINMKYLYAANTYHSVLNNANAVNSIDGGKVSGMVNELNKFISNNTPTSPVTPNPVINLPGKAEPDPIPPTAPVEQPLAPPSHDGFSDQLAACPDKHWKVAYYGQFNVWEAQDVKHISDFPGLFGYECLFNEENSDFLVINEDVKRSVKPLTLQGATFIDDNYTAVFQKNINFPANGYYVFSFSNVDDGIELIVNDKSFLRVWEPSEAMAQSPRILLNAGSNRIVIKHLERSYGASFNFSFQQVN